VLSCVRDGRRGLERIEDSAKSDQSGC